MDKRKPRQGILSEEVRRGEDASSGDDEAINPYWLAEEPEPHPNPELGCVRRGLCCRSSPGRFSPGEVERAAELMGLEPGEFVQRYIVIDQIEADGETVEVFAPVKLGRDGQPMYPTARRVDRLYQWLRGTCVFFTGDGCGIYEARPTECARYICTNAPEENMSPAELAQQWRQG